MEEVNLFHSAKNKHFRSFLIGKEGYRLLTRRQNHTAANT